jgi:hypothetical protein
MTTYPLPQDWHQPPAEFSLAPFWFWNDHLEEAEIIRQMTAFQAHGVDAFVLHPRLGLPRDLGWMSDALLDKMRFAIERAAERKMWVILYDEGMYPSGSSSGQVVAENPAYQCRGLVRVNLSTATPNTTQNGVQINANGEIALTPEQTLISISDYQGQRYAIVDRPIQSTIRGLHYLDEDEGTDAEDAPPAADLLNPDAMACFIRLVYDRYYAAFSDYFGTVIQAIFTDEPMLLGRTEETDILPGTSDILAHINAFLGYDFAPHLPALWDENAPPHLHHDYHRAIAHRLEQTYYQPLQDWCEAHQIALTGHPAEPDALTHLRHFHIPGQDIVWRFIEPDTPTALEGAQSTQAKAAASVMLHQGLRRNANEFCGAYGHELSFAEMTWLAHWLIVRGCNLLIPHAFYYSVRGHRRDERPPDVGLHSPWWGEDFSAFARACQRLCWLNTDSTLICHVAIFGHSHQLPWEAAKACFQHQVDFNYIDADDLIHRTTLDESGLHIGQQCYSILILEASQTDHLPEGFIASLPSSVTLIDWNTPDALSQLQAEHPAGLFTFSGNPGLRVRHIRKAGFDWHILFNEEITAITLEIPTPANSAIIQPYTGDTQPFSGILHLEGHALSVLAIPITEAQP